MTQPVQEVKCPRCEKGVIPISWANAYCSYCSQYLQVVACNDLTCALHVCHGCLTRMLDPKAEKPGAGFKRGPDDVAGAI